MEDIENEGREAGESTLEYSSGLNTQVSNCDSFSFLFSIYVHAFFFFFFQCFSLYFLFAVVIYLIL